MQVAFCDTFAEGPTTNGPANSRAGTLNGVLWGTSMDTGVAGNPVANVPMGTVNDAAGSSACATGATVNYPANIQVCNGQLTETTNDGGVVSSLAMYPRQPFNFAGRTGTIVFDASNNSQGSHAAWPELWVSDQPVPDPFTHESSWETLPRNGFGIRFSGCGATCSLGQDGVGVDSAITVSNYTENDSFNGGNLNVIEDGSVLKSGPGQLNHYEVRVSTSEIDVYGTNPFTGTWNSSVDPLVLLATIPNANLSFTQGVVWLEDVHYNGDKFNSQRENSFTWDNVGFDGPVEPRDLGFDVPANTTPDNNINGTGLSGLDTAYTVAPNASINLTAPGVTAGNITAASAALLTFNFYPDNDVAPVNPIQVAVNGHQISVPWPYPDNTAGSPRTLAVSVPLADVVSGNNKLTFSTGNYALDIANVDLILAGAGGIVQP